MDKKTKPDVQNNTQLLYWRDLISEAESCGSTRADWMKSRGIKESTYYYWHRKLSSKGMLGGGDRLPDREKRQSIHRQEPVCGGTALVEYSVSTPSDISSGQLDGTQAYRHPAAQIPQIMVEANGLRIYLGDGFSSQALKRILEVASNA